MSHLFNNGRESGAIFSGCRRWRYKLWRIWDPDKGTVMFIGLNPSTADETQPDPTITRCINFAESWGYGALLMYNLFAFKSTNPKGLDTVDDPIGPMNDAHLRIGATEADLIVAAWGANRRVAGRDKQVLSLLPNVNCLRITKKGYPEHPLYIPGNTDPIPYEVPQ